MFIVVVVVDVAAVACVYVSMLRSVVQLRSKENKKQQNKTNAQLTQALTEQSRERESEG